MAIKVLFHSFGSGKHCPDGFAAAFCAWQVFGDQAQYIPCVYQRPAPEIAVGDIVYLLDFSYPRDILLKWDQMEGVVVNVLDHHKTAQEDLKGLDFAEFDMDKSGAQLTWERFNADLPAPVLIDYVADRDLWRKELPYTEEIHKALSSFPQDFRVWDTLVKIPDYVDFMRRIGEPLYRAYQMEVDQLMLTARSGTFMGHKILATYTENLSLVSDALNKLCIQHPDIDFALNYRRIGSWIKMELRSTGDFDVSEIAKQCGGGGHRNASGCEFHLTDPHFQKDFHLNDL